MKEALVIPKLSQTMEEAVVEEILVASGDHVEADQVIVNIAADKANAELTAEKAGYIQIACEVDDEIEVGKPYAYIADTVEELGL